MQGRVHVKAGSEGFESDLGAWTYLGTKALGSRPYTPDFDARMVAGAGCRVLRIKADAFHAALRMAKADEIMGARAMKQVSTNSVVVVHCIRFMVSCRKVACAEAQCCGCAVMLVRSRLQGTVLVGSQASYPKTFTLQC